jgi:glutamyl-tRNA synthetase
MEERSHFLRTKVAGRGATDQIKRFLSPLFLAIAGTTSSFSVMDAKMLLGPDIRRARLRHDM